MPPRRRLTAAARREQLLDVCAAIVDTEGFAAVTIDRVATACDVTRTVVYQQFGGLDGMLDALVARATDRAAAAVESTPAPDGPASLRSTMSRILDAVDADPATWRMFLVAPQVGPPALADNLTTGRALVRTRNEAVFSARDDGPGTDPELTARLLQAMADEVVRLRLADPSAYPVERLLAQVEWMGAALLGADDADEADEADGAEPAGPAPTTTRRSTTTRRPTTTTATRTRKRTSR